MTMKELAELAGVSSSAVSRYLNGGSLSQDKRDRIRAAIDETGYQPDPAAQMLRTGTPKQVALILPKLDSESVSRVTRGISKKLLEAGYLSLLADTSNDPEKEIAYLKLFQNRQTAGIILLATVLTPQHEELLKNSSIPIVVIGQRFRQVPCVYHDDFGSAYELTKLHLERGRKNLSLIGITESDIAVGLNRRKGVESAMKDHGLDPDTLIVEHGDFSLESGRAAMLRLLNADHTIDSVICATDRMAFGALDALKEAGLRIPEDISISGFDDNWACRYISPNLTSVRFYYTESGVTAAELLLEMIEKHHSDEPVKQTMLGYSIQERGTI